MSKPKVSIICTSYNHEAYIEEALESVKAQNYPHLELIIIDNGSQDRSREKILNWNINNADLSARLMLREERENYCRSFNEALFKSTGDFIIDLAGDDALLKGHLASAIGKLVDYPEAAVCFSDAELVEGDRVKGFYQYNKFGPPTDLTGNVYPKVIDKYCICTASMVFRASHLKAVGGYDENLVYEDFDILCRLARQHPFCYSPHMGIKKRLLINSFSASQYASRNSKMLESTLKVCYKIKEMNTSAEEDKALYRRLMFEAKHALWSANFKVADGFLKLAKELESRTAKYHFFALWQKSKLDLSRIYQRLK